MTNCMMKECVDKISGVSAKRGCVMKVVEFEHQGNDLTIYSRSRQTNDFPRGVLSNRTIVIVSTQPVCPQLKQSIVPCYRKGDLPDQEGHIVSAIDIGGINRILHIVTFRKTSHRRIQ